MDLSHIHDSKALCSHGKLLACVVTPYLGIEVTHPNGDVYLMCFALVSLYLLIVFFLGLLNSIIGGTG